MLFLLVGLVTTGDTRSKDASGIAGVKTVLFKLGEWVQQATLAIRAHVPLEVLNDTIQPCPSFSGS